MKDFMLVMVMQFFWKLSHCQRVAKIACVATLTPVGDMKAEKSQKKIVRNPMSWIFCDKIMDFVNICRQV